MNCNIEVGHNGKVYLVFEDEDSAEAASVLFCEAGIEYNCITSFGNFMNAIELSQTHESKGLQNEMV